MKRSDDKSRGPAAVHRSWPSVFVSDRSIPDRSIPDRSIPDRSIPDRSIPGRFIPARFIPASDVYCPSQHRQRRLFGRFRQRRMGVDGGANVIGACAVLETEDDFGDELGDVGTNQVGAQELVGPRVGNELHEP